MAELSVDSSPESPGFTEAKQYVRQQLSAMGAGALPEHQLESYTRGGEEEGRGTD